MKTFLLLSIDFYQKYISIIIKQLLGANNFCRFNPSCSSYAKQVVVKYGVFKGGYKTMKRLLSCNPFVNPV